MIKYDMRMIHAVIDGGREVTFNVPRVPVKGDYIVWEMFEYLVSKVVLVPQDPFAKVYLTSNVPADQTSPDFS
jgi:hypothetical protein